MQPPEMNIKPIATQNFVTNLKNKIGYWLGRLWGICTYPFAVLINRIKKCAFKQFSKIDEKFRQKSGTLTNTVKVLHPQTTPQNINAENRKNEEEEWDLSNFFDLNEHDVETNGGRKAKNHHPAEPLVSVKDKFDADSTKMSEPSLESLSFTAQTNQENTQEISKVESKASKINTSSQFQTKFRKRLNHGDSKPTVTSILKPPVSQLEKSSISETKSTSVLPKTIIVPTLPEPIIIEAGGGGDCQLLSILKGLEMQYPELMQHEENQKVVKLTASKLREIGVAFAREQIDRCGIYAEAILGLVDSDRREYNEAVTSEVEQNLNNERANLEQDLSDKKINAEDYIKQRKKIEEKTSEIMQELENHLIDTDAEFLNYLEKEGFFCSTLHLFALSVKFKLPIYVREEAGVPGHQIQMFNPTESKKDPIHLYRVRDNHYQLILYPQSNA
jgi:hypothetical protein